MYILWNLAKIYSRSFHLTHSTRAMLTHFKVVVVLERWQLPFDGDITPGMTNLHHSWTCLCEMSTYIHVQVQCVAYCIAGKLSREKTFTVWEPPMKLFSTKCSLPTDPHSFLPQKFPTIIMVSILWWQPSLYPINIESRKKGVLWYSNIHTLCYKESCTRTLPYSCY